MIVTPAVLRAATDRAMLYARELVFGVVRFTKYAKSSADGNSDQVEGHPAASTDNSGQTPAEEVRRMGPFGLRSRPPKGVPCVVVRAGGRPPNGIVVGADAPKYGPSNLNDGEVALYNTKTGVVVLLDKNGAITITDTGGNQIKLNGTNAISISGASGTAITVSAGSGAAVNINSGAGANVVLNNGVNNIARASVDTAGPYPIVGGALFAKA